MSQVKAYPNCPRKHRLRWQETGGIHARTSEALDLMATKPVLTNETAWHALTRKNRRYDGKFVYAAVTTGIYCRPSCPARNPKRRNTLIFWTSGEAEREGYNACLRCHPNSLAPAESAIKTVLEYVEAHLDDNLTLQALSEVASLSPHHLQEVFKKIVGLSPKTFCDARRIACFRRYLRSGYSIAAACYAVGYGSSRALYERTNKSLGMTPSIYQRGGEGLRIRYATTNKAERIILIARTDMGFCSVSDGEEEGLLIRELREEFPKADLRRESSANWKSAVRDCEIQDPLLSMLPIRLRTGIFRAKVWNALTPLFYDG